MSISLTSSSTKNVLRDSQMHQLSGRLGYLLIQCAVEVLLVAFCVEGVIELNTAAGASVLVWFLDMRNPLILKNAFLVYAYCLFVLAGNHYFPGEDDLFTDMLAYVGAYLVGYHGGETGFRPRSSNVSGLRRPMANDFQRIRFLEKITISYILLYLLFLVWQVRTYGFGEFYQGAALASAIASYAEGGLALGVGPLISTSLNLFKTAMCIHYVSTCVEVGVRPRWGLLGVLMLGLPLASLSRASVVDGCIFLSVVGMFCMRWRNATTSKWLLVSIVFGITAICAAIGIGALRANRLSNDPTAMPITEDQISKLVYGELTPIVVYTDLKRNIKSIGYQYGWTIGPPLLLKAIPRRWLPDKPPNTSILYMRMFAPTAYAAGYSIPPSIFGDVYLNFGWYGCLGTCLFLGLATRWADRRFVLRDRRGLHAFLLFHCNFYSLLRNNTGDALGMLCITIVVYALLRKLCSSSPATNVGSSRCGLLRVPYARAERKE